MKGKWQGFSLLDMAYALFVSGLLFAIFTSSIPNYNKILKKIQSKIGFEEQMVVFFLQLEADFFSVALDSATRVAITKDFTFERWLWNANAGVFEKKESTYQFQSSSKKIRRKIGKEVYFTSLLEQVENFEYETLDYANAFCLKVAIQSVFDDNFRKQVFCRHFPNR